MIVPNNHDDRPPYSEIGGFRIYLDPAGDPQRQEGHGDAADDGYTTEVRLRLHRGVLPTLPRDETIFDTGLTWALYRSGDSTVLQDDCLDSEYPPETIIALDRDYSAGDVYITDDTRVWDTFHSPLGYPLNQILMIMLLSRGKGVLLHACGVDDHGRGYLFPGNSTNGKSTIAKQWYDSGATILNDDRIMVRERDGQLWMYGTPWHGDFREISLTGIPINTVFFLRHGTENRAVLKKSSEAVSMFLTRSFPPLWDQKGMDYTLGFLDGMAKKLPCYELSFLPDKTVIDFVRNT